ncbi:MAG: SRPBCC family protein [Chloroflexota bacterium]
MTADRTSRLARFAWLSLTALSLAAGLLIGYITVIRPWHMRWGMRPAELAAAHPGDEFVAAPLRASTRGITIHAPAAQVWPWLAQISAERAGFYSYDWLEQLMLCPIHNADRIHPEWQNVQPGDRVALCPQAEMPPPYEVIQVLPGQALVLGHRAAPADNLPGALWAESWAFILEPVDANATRLVVRTRSAIDPAWMSVIEPGVFIMEYGMLNGIKARSEGLSTPSVGQLLARAAAGVALALLVAGAVVFFRRGQPAPGTSGRAE